MRLARRDAINSACAGCFVSLVVSCLVIVASLAQTALVVVRVRTALEQRDDVIDFDGRCYAAMIQASLAQPVVPAHYSSAISNRCAASLAWCRSNHDWNKKAHQLLAGFLTI
jgi:hypothetical protein